MTQLHANETAISTSLVQKLISQQFPHWSSLTIRPFPSSGTDNVIYRLGDDLLVRLPRLADAATRLKKEAHWLPVLAPSVPLTIPVPLAMGQPGADYPFCWAVYPWLEGENATLSQLAHPVEAAQTLARFIIQLQQIDASAGPLPGVHNSGRGVPLAQRHAQTLASMAELEGMIDTKAATAVWQRAVGAPAWQKAPVWIHGDLQSGNLLAHEGELTAVIDFGCLGVGDPACDLMAAWTLFPPTARQAFYTAVSVDDATWERGRGWALSFAVIALPYYQTSNPVLADIARYTIEQILEEG